MTDPLSQKQAIAQAVTILADFLGGKFGNPLDIDAEDQGRLREALEQIETHLGVCEAKDLLRAQSWGGRVRRGRQAENSNAKN